MGGDRRADGVAARHQPILDLAVQAQFLAEGFEFLKLPAIAALYPNLWAPDGMLQAETLGMFAVAAVSGSRNMTVFWSLLGLLAIVHATHDIACDGFYLQALDKTGGNADAAAKWIDEMGTKNRYVLDVWAGG